MRGLSLAVCFPILLSFCSVDFHHSSLSHAVSISGVCEWVVIDTAPNCEGGDCGEFRAKKHK